MRTHFDQLCRHIPDLPVRRILDIGSGRGDFLIEAVKRGAHAIGVERNREYIDMAHQNAQREGFKLTIIHSFAEELPLARGSVDFVNLSEVLEHVEDPSLVLSEVCRVLSDQGMCYASLPNRFGMRDPHFHLFGVNWIPRMWSDAYLGLFGRHKKYTTAAGRQRLRDMHYYTYRSACKMIRSCGFIVWDIRERRIKRRFGLKSTGLLAMLLYGLMRPWYFDTFHFLIMKQPQTAKQSDMS